MRISFGIAPLALLLSIVSAQLVIKDVKRSFLVYSSLIARSEIVYNLFSNSKDGTINEFVHCEEPHMIGTLATISTGYFKSQTKTSSLVKKTRIHR